MATIAMFIALGGTATIAATSVCSGGLPCVNSDDIIDGEVKTEDIGTGQVKTADIGTGQVRSIDVADDTTAFALTGADVLGDSLTGADINEASLNLPLDPILIQRHEFDTTEGAFNTTTDWEVVEQGGAALKFDPTNSMIDLETQESPFSPGSVVVRGRRSASASDGTLVLTTRLIDAYAEQSGSVYGDAQPRGLANGSSRDNAIEFINAGGSGATLVGCRTVSGGTATQTNADIGQWVREPAVYQIVATPSVAKFYVNGALVCTHTTNIPTTPLNIYFSTSDGGAGNVPVLIDWVSFERRG
jgi:hypothetical protein